MLRTEIRTKEILLIFGLCISTVVTYTEHQTLILSGVERVLRTNNPGTISLLNENSFPILAGSFGRTLRSHVAAVEYGAGRIIAHSHTDSLLQANMPSGYDNYQLLINSINWLGKNGTGKIGLYPDWRTRQNILSELGYETQVLSANDFNNPTYLEQFYVIIIGGNVNETSVREYVRSGVGGLMIAATPWNHNANNMESFWGNIILRDTGLFYLGSYGSYGTMDCNNQGGGCFNASTEFLKDTHSVHVWNALKQFNSYQTHLPRDRTEQVIQILRDRLLYTPRDDIFNRDINAELKRLPTFVPTATNPVTAENEKYFLILHRYLCEFLIIIVGLTSDIPPHPSALSFPGDVVTSSGQRLSHLIEIDAMLPSWTENLSVDEIIDFDTRDTKIYENGDESELQIPSDVIEVNTRGTAWYSTGLYARPGDEIHIQVLNATNWGFDLDVQIGAHTDDLEPLSSWRRCPRIVFRNTIRNNRSSIANPFGGPIYIVLNNYNDNVMLQLSITGGIRSPTYFMGETLLSQWRNEIRSSAAPWGELIGKNLIILTQNQYLSQMDDPEAIIDFWDRVLDAISDLGAMPRERVKSERFVADVQISDGFMHSGYPIMYHLFDQDKPLGISEFRTEPYRLWGFLHELGHNHQKTDWTFSGTGEVTCNIFVLYVMHNILLAPTNKTHPDLTDAYVAQTLRQYINDGKRFSDWKSKPFLALLTYIQLQEYFGWSAYQRVFSNYNQLTGDERPRNDQEKMDLWMIMFSRVVEENLTPFFTSWGFPISPEAEYYVRDLPYTNLRIADQW